MQTQNKWADTNLEESGEEDLDVSSLPGGCCGVAHGCDARGGAMLPGVGAMLAACTAPPSAPA